VIVAVPLLLGLAGHPGAVLFVTLPLFLCLAGAAVRFLAGLPLGLGLRARGILLFLDPVVLDPSQLAQRK